MEQERAAADRVPGEIRLGDTVAWAEGKVAVKGTVVTLRATGDAQVLGVLLASGEHVFVEARRCRQRPTSPDLVVETATHAASARALAAQVITGAPVRLPVQVQLRTLALAVLGAQP